MKPVDVLIPIHDAREFTIRCIESVLAHTPPEARVVLADDASRDRELVRHLEEVAAREPRVVLRRSERNRGFVGTCNAAFAAARGRDVLLLNSDTVVTPGYLERIQRCADATSDTGIVSPLSNNATILSVPRFCEDNPIPAGHTIDSFAELVARVSPRLHPEIVTAVGFCMYVKAEVLDRIGHFDTENFGRGYGEENDFCERALAAGYRIRVADDAFVFHQGGASFGAETEERKRLGSDAMTRLHPTYLPRVFDFIAANPLRPIHDAIELGLARRNAEAPALLVLVHASLDRPAGGAEHHVRELLERVRLPRVLVAVPDAQGISLSEVFDGDLAGAISYRFPLAKPLERFTQASPAVHDALTAICRAFGVGAAHIHHLLYWPLDLWRALEALGIPHTLTTHDFYTLCPSHNLVNSTTGRPCCLAGSPSDEERRQCIQELFHNLAMPLREPALAFRDSHRRAARRLIDRAHSLVFPSEAAAAIFRAQAGALPAASRVIPHGYDTAPLGPRPDRADVRMQVAFLGEIAYKTKGADDILSLLRKSRRISAVWHVFGNVGTFGFEKELERVGLGDSLVLHGPYQRETIGALLRRHQIDVAVFLPAAPETFSFTLSEALTAGVPVVVNRSGALPERVESSGAGLVVDGVDEAAAALSRFAHQRRELRELRAVAERFRHRTLAEMAADYRRLYDELMPAAAASGISPANAEDARLLVELRRAAAATGPTIRDRPIPRLAWLAHPLVRSIAKRAIPERIRRVLRPATAALTAAAPPRNVFQSFPIDGASTRTDLHPRRSLGGRTRYEALGDDPQIRVPMPGRSLDVAPVRTIEFDLLCESTNERHAQLFWTHAEGESFSEEKSIRVPLTGDGVWRTYSVDIVRSDKREAWSAGSQVRALRFDPMDGPGVVAVGTLRFLR